MRLKMIVSGAGDCSMTRFPCVPETPDDLKGADGKIDFGKVSAALGRDAEFVQLSDGDDLATLTLGYEFLRQLHGVVTHLVEDKGRDLRGEPQTPCDKSLERRMDKGRYCYVRLDFRRRSGDTMVRLQVSNPREVAGTAPARARDIAVMCARILQELKRQMDAHGCVPIALLEGEGADGVFEAATAMEEYDALREKRAKCCRRMNGIYCSPADFACPLYREGKCTAPKSPME